MNFSDLACATIDSLIADQLARTSQSCQIADLYAEVLTCLLLLTGLYLLFHHGMTMAKTGLCLIQVRAYSNVQLEECLISIIAIFPYMERNF